jgi:hypothetical protein
MTKHVRAEFMEQDGGKLSRYLIFIRSGPPTYSTQVTHEIFFRKMNLVYVNCGEYTLTLK